MERNLLDEAADMIRADDKRVQVVPLTQVVRMQKTRAGCEIVIGAPESVMVGLATSRYRGGLLLIDSAEPQPQP